MPPRPMLSVASSRLPMTVRYLLEADWVLRSYEPAEFDAEPYAFAQCAESVRVVEDNGSWRSIYSSLDAFYAAYEDQHPDVRRYGVARRELAAGALAVGRTEYASASPVRLGGGQGS